MDIKSLPKVSIVIPCRNEENFIIDCIQSCLNSDYTKTLIEVIVCDGLSTDNTVGLIKEKFESDSRVKILINSKMTTPFALNLGIKNSYAPYVMILGAHSKISSNYIINAINVLEEKPEIGCAGGLLKNQFSDDVSKAISKAMSSTFGVGSAHFRTGLKSGFVDTVAFGVYRKNIFDEIGFFDEELTRNQDDEFNFRLLKSGYKIWLDIDSYADYFVRSSWKKLRTQYFQYGYWKVFVNTKHKIITTLRQLVPVALVLYLLFTLPVILISYSPLTILYFLFLLVYLLFVFIGSITIKPDSFLEFINVMRAIFTLHLAYGYGYLLGIVDFVIRRKRIASSYNKLSR